MTQYYSHIPFGWEQPDGMVHIFKFGPDPDGGDLPWFEKTEEVMNLGSFNMIGSQTEVHNGKCDDTGMYTSHLGILCQKLLKNAPEGTELVTFSDSSSCGTKTFEEKVTANFYFNS